MTEARLAAVRAAMVEAELDGLLVTNAQNRRYLSGFTGSAGVLLISATTATLITDGRYTTQAAAEAPGFEVVTRLGSETPAEAVAQLANSINTLGFDPDDLSMADYGAYGESLKGQIELEPVKGLIEEQRTLKSADELATLREAIAITDAALAQVRPLLRPTMLERELAWELHKALVELGAAGPSFDIIVAAGRNSALPHAHPGAEPLGLGRPIVIDMGALLDGYHADMTRTLILGHADAQFERVYAVVHEALTASTAALRPGMQGQAADAVARDIIAAAGFGAAFSHSLGHGVGLEIHEGPRLSAASSDTLQSGAVFSIEPGIYLPEWGGVRLENLVLLGPDGAETLTAAPLDMPVVVLD